MRWAIAYPCSAPGWSTRSTSIARVPGSMSLFLAIGFQGLDSLCLALTSQAGIGEREKKRLPKLPKSPKLPELKRVRVSSIMNTKPQRFFPGIQGFGFVIALVLLIRCASHAQNRPDT